MKLKHRHIVDSHSVVSENGNLDTFTSLFTKATTTDDTLTNTTLKSNVWEHFERNIDILPLKAKCLLCKEELLTPNYATTSLRQRLIQRHSFQQLVSIKKSYPSISNRNLSKKEKRKLDSLAVDTISEDSSVFSGFQKSGFNKLVQALKPGKDFSMIL